MSDLNAVYSLSKKLFEAVLAEDAKAARIIAADLKAAHEAPQGYTPWTPSNMRNAS